MEGLKADSTPQWGKMNVAQMLAHCCVPYEMALDNLHQPEPWLIRKLLKMFAKETVVGTKPYKKGTPTGKAFQVSENQNFEDQKNRLIQYLRATQEKGISYFEGKAQLNFGILTGNQWNNMFYKHLDHHLKQFGA